ncbi:cell wall-active antibiotics response protein [Peribacillus cavernae]|uniref:Cell wall-active antibiotics response protein n=1 Tax=Peribacillus cavernae TaxID=1674310 RepID=A0A3S0VNJ5_9BACI|nr:cell wall-active antibiotics response protein LiaF [Peribacillus cavernae]MDQ0218612.1 lia operon protein LiaF [Peribacillus cavernae]RUQ31596.1 cell wall-active antibiotics response protein [Peribacillus cavernae]
MFKHMKTDYIGWILLIGIILLFLEISFFNGGLLFSLAITIGLTYFGRKLYPRKRGKIMFWIGLIGTVITVVNMMIFKFFLLAILVHLILVFYQSKKNPEVIIPLLVEPGSLHGSSEKEPILKTGFLLQNKWFGRQKTPEHMYEWNDINIQGGIGDTIIDLSNTILPKGEAVISIRNLIGNIQIFVPYDIEISIHHSVVAGKAAIFQHQETRVFNQILSYQTEDYQHAAQKMKIITSVLTGDIEVKRI